MRDQVRQASCEFQTAQFVQRGRAEATQKSPLVSMSACGAPPRPHLCLRALLPTIMSVLCSLRAACAPSCCSARSAAPWNTARRASAPSARWSALTPFAVASACSPRCVVAVVTDGRSCCATHSSLLLLLLRVYSAASSTHLAHPLALPSAASAAAAARLRDRLREARVRLVVPAARHVRAPQVRARLREERWLPGAAAGALLQLP